MADKQLVKISDDAVARALGADALAAAFEKQGCEVQRTSSWGMQWLEPLVEIDGIGWGPASLEDVGDILAGDAEEICIGPIAAHPFIARQQRLTFARAGKTRPTEPRGLRGDRRLGRRCSRAKAIGSEAILEEVTQSGLRGRGGAGFPAGIKWQTVAKAAGRQKYIVCNADEGDSGTFADRMVMEGDPFALIEGMAIAGAAVGADQGYIYVRSEYPDAIRKLNEALEQSPGHRRPVRAAKCASARAPMSAARKPRCSTGSKASAAKCAPSRRCRRSRGRSASRRWSTTCSPSPPCRTS